MEEKGFDEKEILEQIKKDADTVPIPEELHPEQIRKKLESEKKKIRRKHRRQLTAAAAIALCTVTAIAGNRILRQNDVRTASRDTSGVSQETDGGTETGKLVADIGDVYQNAKNYTEVYEELKRTQEQSMLDGSSSIESSAEDAVDSAGSDMGDSVTTTGESSEDKDYSTTNLQTDGIDESDITKTDGNYIYTVWNNKVQIYDIRNVTPQEIAEITPDTGSAADDVREMYVDDDELILIVQKQESDIRSSDTENSGYETCYMVNEWSTEVLKYDISDRTTPVLAQNMEQDGAYQTSRKVGTILYLFTNYDMQLPEYEQDTAVKSKLSTWIPSVAGQLIEADSIYLPDTGSSGLILSSVNCRNIQKPIDTKLIVQDGVQVYVSDSSLYLYGRVYNGGNDTQIARFAMADGTVTPAGAAAVKGVINDTFAINEYQGYLRVLTTDWSGSTETNAVYVYDSAMKLTGQITGIAQGEEIYSARFLKNTGYFVTYENTDPLFTVDFSDPANPVLAGELQITGFSEYLHFWGENKLLGIGYETDPVTGEQKGLKLSMFDISDPSHVTEENRLILENIDYSPALYEYKCVLANAEKNIIGFTVEHYDTENTINYVAFSYENGFGNLFSAAIDSSTDASSYRGLYAGDTFYVVGGGTVNAYDMTDGYQNLPSS